MRHSRSEPDNQKVHLFATDAGQATEQFGQVILSVPFGQMRQKLRDGIVRGCGIRVDHLLDISLRTIFGNLLSLGFANDAVHRFRCQCSPNRLTISLFGAYRRILYLAIQHVSTELVVVRKKLLNCERVLQRGSQRLSVDCHFFHKSL